MQHLSAGMYNFTSLEGTSVSLLIFDFIVSSPILAVNNLKFPRSSTLSTSTDSKLSF